MFKKYMSIMMLVLAFTVFAFGGVSSAKSKVLLYTSVPQSIIDKIRIAFTSKHPDVQLEVYRTGTGKVLAKIYAEHEGGKIQADLVWVADFSVYESLKGKGILMQYFPPEAKELPAEFIDGEGYYYGARLINMVIGYNTRRVKGDGIPKSWKDLLAPKLKGRIGMCTPVRCGSMMVTYGAFLSNPELGWDYFDKIYANGVKHDSNTGVAKKIATGELLMGFVLDYAIRGMEKKGSPIGFVWPQEGCVMVPSPIGIVADTKNMEGAKTFLRYSLSREGQREFVKAGFIPVRGDVEPPAGTPPLNQIKTLQVDYKWLVKNQKEIVKRFEKIAAKYQ
ncbi:MAG: ABC transporter substrate-binding protein [Desulfatiglandaceae bacterium]